jgi:peroxiredoxin
MKNLLLIAGILGILSVAPFPAMAELDKNDVAPDFTLRDAKHQRVALRDIRAKKTVILVFLRGSFSPQCIKQLKQLQANLEEIEKFDAEIIAILRDEKGALGPTIAIQKSEAKFTILSDYRAEETPRYSPDNDYDSYIIDPNGRIIKVLKGSKLNRPTGDEILAAVEEATD